MVKRVGVEPTVFLTCLIYSQVSSPLDIPLQNWVSSWIYTNMVLIQRFMLIAMKIFMFHCLSTRKYPITEHPPMRARLVVTPYTHIIWRSTEVSIPTDFHLPTVFKTGLRAVSDS